jgi:hypothetical protein
MTALLAGLTHGPRRQRKRWLAAGLAALVVAATAVVVVELGSTAHELGPSCEGAARLLAGVWDGARARAIDQRFAASQRGDAAAAFASASLLLDQYANEWIALRTDACKRAQRGPGAEASSNLRIQCLEARRSELRIVTDRLAALDGDAVDDASVEVRRLGALTVCSDDDGLRTPMRAELAARPGSPAVVDAAGRTSYFVITADQDEVLSQVRLRDGGSDRVPIVDGVRGRPSIVMDREHRLHVFVHRVEQVVWHGWQLPDGSWRAEPLTDAATDDPAAILVGDQLVYFVRKTDGWLWRYWRAAPTGGWIASRVTDAVAGRPGLGLDVAGALYSLVRKADGSLWAARHPGPAEPPDRPVKLWDGIASDPVVVRDTADKLSYYVRRADGWLITGYQDAAGSAIWHGVTLVEGVAGDPAVAFDAEGKQICMIRTTGGSLWSAIQDTPSNGPWHEAVLADGITGDPTLVLDPDRRLSYFVATTGGARVRGRQDAPLASTWHQQALESPAINPY